MGRADLPLDREARMDYPRSVTPIAILAETEQLLHKCLVHHPEDPKSFERVIEFGPRVGQELERLLQG